MLVFSLAITQPVAAQSFKPNIAAGEAAYFEEDYATALKHSRPLAKQGNADAQGYLGVMYSNGAGVTQDYKEAVKWYRKASVQGNADAQYSLCTMYRDGHGVVQDLVMAYVWCNVASALGRNGPGMLRDETHEKLNIPERKLALKLSKLCLKNPVK